jgi:hypothetical protein
MAKARKKRTVKNPVLIKINPDRKKVEAFWKKAVRLKPDLDWDEFEDGLALYLSQHGEYPDHFEVADVPVDVGVLVHGGRVRNFIYKAPRHSRKSKSEKNEDIEYIHKTGDHIYTSVDGKRVKVLLGPMKMNPRDGWFHK